MKKMLIGLIFLALLGSTAAFAQSEQPLEAGVWNQIRPGGETTCAYGEAYSFFVRPGDESRLMIHFQGGGACWNSGNCREESAFKSFDSSVTDDELALYEFGIFDQENAENPVKEFTSILVTYCTGDVHVGNATTTYDDLTIEHKGRVNVEAVLEWVYENYPNPAEVFVNGCSAGGYGAIFYAPSIFEHYPDARHTHLSDAAVGINADGWNGLAQWGFFEVLADYYPELADVSPLDFSNPLIYEAAGVRFPEANFAQYTAVEDEVQTLFYQIQGGLAEDWSWLAQDSFTRLNTNMDNFSSFTAEGKLHCIIPLPEFYEYETNGVRVRDWMAELLTGARVPSVRLTGQ